VLVSVISDTHMPRGSRRLPDRCLQHLRRADLLLHAGDLTSLAFLDELLAVGPPVRAVYGNADEPTVRERLPAQLVVEACGARIGLVHIPGPRATRQQSVLDRFPGCDAVVYGHTHLPQVERIGQVWLLNPGSPTERRRAAFRSMLLLEISAGGVIQPELITLS
jgi:putative phosphoesterase